MMKQSSVSNSLARRVVAGGVECVVGFHQRESLLGRHAGTFSPEKVIEPSRIGSYRYDARHPPGQMTCVPVFCGSHSRRAGIHGPNKLCALTISRSCSPGWNTRPIGNKSISTSTTSSGVRYSTRSKLAHLIREHVAVRLRDQ